MSFLQNDNAVEAMTTKTILFIHCNSTVREIVQDCLVDLGGWQVISPNSLSEALSDAVQFQPDAIVLNFSGVSTDHFAFLNALKAQPETQFIPVVLIVPGAKWFSSQQLQQLKVIGAIDDSVTPLELPLAIAKLLKWGKEIHLTQQKRIETIEEN